MHFDRQHQNEKDSNQPDGSKFHNFLNEENELFLELDDVPGAYDLFLFISFIGLTADLASNYWLNS